jgi:UDP-N-acetylglucosamine diphosphorylase/glucosamine-1-phosphate N-acetyltransferase
MSTHPHHAHHAPIAIILAAGKGTRMESDLPKVLHPIAGRPMLCAVVDACRQAGCKRIVLVVGYKHELVREAMNAQGAAWASGLEYALQAEQLGTGHAVRMAEGLFAGQLKTPGQPVFVLAGDGPLIRGQTLKQLLDLHVSSKALATLATSVIDDPTGYGRIVRDAKTNRFAAIVEHKDCTSDQLKIREVNPSYYCFDLAAMYDALTRVKRNERAGEYYLTDVPALLLHERGPGCVEVIDAVPPEDVLSINTPAQLAQVDAIYRSRTGHQAQKAAR